MIGFTAATTAVAGLLQFKQFAADLSLSAAIKSSQVTIAESRQSADAPADRLRSPRRRVVPVLQHRHDDARAPRSELLDDQCAVGPARPQGADSAGRGSVTGKLNAAYSVGGPDLLLKVLRQQVFPGLHVNHIIDVNFGGFEALVNAIGCVYIDVDHRYFNNTAFTNYSSIDIQPGYQKLCGTDALSFVRFRHTDTDIVRNARQQDFLRWAKSQYSVSQIVSNRDRLLSIFGKHTQTDHDLHTTDGLINLFNLVAFSAGHADQADPLPGHPPALRGLRRGRRRPVRDARRRATWQPIQGPKRRAFAQFLAPTVPTPPPAKPAGPSRHGPSGSGGLPPGIAADLSGRSDGTGRGAALDAGMPVYVPRLIVAASHYCTNATCNIGPVADSYPRSYRLRATQGRVPRGLPDDVLALNPVLGQYYGVQGTTWRNPPILNGPTETRMVDGKKLLLFFNGHKLTLVAWQTAHAAYWISNTLTDDVTNAQMVAIAASLHPAGK